MSRCLTKLKASLKERKIRFSGERLQEISDKLDAQRADLLTKPEFAKKLAAIIQQDVELIVQKMKALEIQKLNTITAAQDRILDTSLPNSTVKENLLSWPGGGGVRPTQGGRMDPKDIADRIEGETRILWRRETGDLKRLSESGLKDLDTARELSAIQEGKTTGLTNSKEALSLAKTIDLVEERLFQLKKAFNPMIEKTSDFLVRQSHNRVKVAKVTKGEFVAKYESRFESLPDMNPEQNREYLRNLYDRIKGGIYGTPLDEARYESYGGTSANLQKRMTRSRTLIPKSPEAFVEHMKEFGYGTLDASVNAMIRRSSLEIAQIQKFTATPEPSAKRLFDQVVAKAPAEQRAELRSLEPEFMDTFRTAMGYTDVPARSTKGKIAQGLLSSTYSAMTGGALLRSFPDITYIASAARDINGRSVPANALDYLLSAIKLFSNTTERNKVLESVGLFSKDVHKQILASTGIGGEQTGVISKIAHGMTWLNGLQRWDDTMRAVAGKHLAQDIASVANLSWDKLPESWRKGLPAYEIGPHEWDAGRRAVDDWSSITGEPKSKSQFIDADSIEKLPNEIIENMLRKTGKLEGDATPETLDLARFELANKFGVMINEHADMGAMKTNSRQRAFMYGGRSIDDWRGIRDRMIFQFKGAMTNMWDMNRRSYYAQEHPISGFAAIGSTMATAGFFWALGEYTDQILSGKTPADPLSPQMIGKFVTGSGVGGLYADLLIGTANENGIIGKKGQFLSTLAGPVIGKAAELAALGAQTAEAMKKGRRVPARQWGSYLLSWVPGQNLFYTKAVANFYIFNGFKEFLGPGYLGHLEQMTRQKGQDYNFFRPTDSPIWPKEILP